METSDTAYATSASIATVDSVEQYREELHKQIEKVVSEEGVIALIDWCNKTTERLKGLSEDYHIDMTDILQEELRDYFYKKYPAFTPLRYSRRK